MSPKIHYLKGRKQTPEHIAKRVESTRLTKEAWSEERYRLSCKRLSESHKGNIASEEQKRKQSKAMMGKQNSLGVKRSLEFRRNLSEYWKGNPNHNFRIDGKSTERNGERQTVKRRLEYRLWREAVFERDEYTCVFCGQVGGQISADHIKPYSVFPELRFDVGNGRTLCNPCHKETDTFGWKMAHKIRQHGSHDYCRLAMEEVDA